MKLFQRLLQISSKLDLSISNFNSKIIVKRFFITGFFFAVLFSPLVKTAHVFANCDAFGINMNNGDYMSYLYFSNGSNIVYYPDSPAAHTNTTGGPFQCDPGGSGALLNWNGQGGNYFQTWNYSYAAPSVSSIYFSPSTILTGESSTGNFSSTYAETCTGSGPFWNGGLGTSASASTGAIGSVGSYTQSVSCSNPGGSSGWSSATLTVNGHNCTGTPWGTVAHGYSNTAYSASSADSCAAISQVRSCNDGSMSGSYTFTSCTNKQTTLTTGVDPSSSTISPGGSATFVDSFTFQTNVLTDVITSLIVNLSNASSTSLVEVTDSSGVVVYGSVSNPTGASSTPITLSNSTLTASTTQTTYKIRITPKSHANLPTAALGMLYPINAKVLSWSGANSTKLGSDTSTTTITIDNESQSTTGGAGVTWATSTSVANNSWNSVAYGNGLFVALSSADNGTLNNRVMTSPDGVTWTARTAAANLNWSSVTYGNGLFVAVSISGTGNRVMTSPDGITWTSRTSASDNNWRSVTYGNGLFVAVANSGTGNRVMTSPDGITWTSRNASADLDWVSVTYGNSLFVAVLSGFCTGNCVMTSSDGITWTTRNNGINQLFSSVTYGNGLFVAVPTFCSGNCVMTSPDGITWTARTPAATSSWNSVAYGGGLFIAVSVSGLMSSPDGITWTGRTSAVNNLWNSVTYGNGLFVTVSSSGTGNRVMRSTSTLPTISSVGSNQLTLNYTNPSESDTHSILILRATSTITDVPVDGTAYATGTSIGTATVGCIDTTIATSTSDSCTVTNLVGNTPYYFSLFTKDTYGNYSKAFLPTQDSTTTLIGNPSNVSVISGDKKVTVVYTTSSDINQKGIVILQSTSTIADLPVDGVTYTAGNVVGTSTFICVNPDVGPSTISSCDIPGLINGTAYYYKIFTKSSTNKYSVGVTPTNSPVVPRVQVIASSSVLTGNGKVTISYTTSSSTNQGGVIVLKSTAPITVAPTDGSTYSVGGVLPVGQIAYTTPGSYSWTVPAGVTSVSTVVVGAGGSGGVIDPSAGLASGGGGGGLGWKNNISVTPGESVSVTVGSGGTEGNAGGSSNLSSLSSSLVVSGGGAGAAGVFGQTYSGGIGGSVTSSVGGTSSGGGSGGAGQTETNDKYFGGGGGAGGYSGNGGAGGGTSGTGGGGGGGSDVYDGNFSYDPAGGGGVGIFGQGSSGSGNVGGSGGSNGSGVGMMSGGNGGSYGGGAGAAPYYNGSHHGAGGAVRIIWGSGRSFPSTNTADQPTVEVVCVDGVNTPNTSSSCEATGLSNGTQYYFAVFAKSSIDGAYSASSSPSGSPVAPGIFTLLGSGVDPVSATVAPVVEQVTSNFVNSFTLQSGEGTDVVTSAVVALTDASSTSLVEITNNDGTIVYGSVINPTGATTSVVLSTNTLTSNTTLTQYKIRISPKTQSNLPPQTLGLVYSVTARIESFASSLPHAGSDTSSATLSIDNQSPGLVSGDSVIAGNTKLTVNYTAPSDADYAGAIVLIKTTPITNIPVDGTSYTVGGALGTSTIGCLDDQAVAGGISSCQVTGLNNGVPYYIKIFTKDMYGNWSAGFTPAVIAVVPTVLATSVRVESYRLRNDDGTETSASYSSTENTGNSANFVQGDKTRIRFAVSNQTTQSTTKSYSLEYSSGSCSVWTSVPRKIDATTQHWKIEPSSYVPDNAATTHSSGISVPSGKSFTSGRIQTFNRITQPITLLNNEYTEIEFSLRSTGYLQTNTNYCFRLTDQGESSDFIYSQSLEISPISRVFRYYGGGGNGSQATIESASIVGTTTYTGGVASSTTATSTNLGETSIATTTTSTTTPRRGGGSDGDVGLFKDTRNDFAFNDHMGLVLGDTFTSMCSDMQHRMFIGSTDKNTNGEVSQLQYYLSERGYFTGKITGVYYEKTRKAVEEFQKDNNLIITGISGKVTRAKMRDISCVK